MNRSGIVREPFRPSRAPADQGARERGMGTRELLFRLDLKSKTSVPRESDLALELSR